MNRLEEFNKQVKELKRTHSRWHEEAKELDLLDLPNYIDDVITEVNNLKIGGDDYNICVAISAFIIGLISDIERSYNTKLNEYQVGVILYQLLYRWGEKINPMLKLLDYDDMLYPQYDYRFTTITQEMFDTLQTKARKNINGGACEKVREHWKRTINGEVPFGYKIREKKKLALDVMDME